MFWHHFSLYCASQESAHGAKMCLCTGEDQDKCPWGQYNSTRKPDPTVSLICNDIHTLLPRNLVQKVKVYLPLPWGWWQANQNQEQGMVQGARALLPPVWAPCLPHAGRARGHHEAHQQSQHMPKVKRSFFFWLVSVLQQCVWLPGKETIKKICSNK